uniref:beta-N-acetylhexosaminidase n=1 Tax=Meloidogyne enterolobii TaxID=390850 RepID=A0A6V7U3U2_MELEN|nr:unnamed protein product [Meloidogyne enterolobii]
MNFHCWRRIMRLLLFVFLLYYIYSTNFNDELQILRTQFELKNQQILILKNEINDAQSQLNNLRNSEIECKSQNEVLLGQLKAAETKNDQQDKAVKEVRIQPVKNNKHPSINAIKELDLQHSDYPRLTLEGNFVPTNLWMHFDFKGAPPKPSYFISLLPLLQNMGFNGLLIEWEDMFPYKGKLANAINGDAYTMNEVEKMLAAAKEYKFEIVPLVQTFGHLEWILKLNEFKHLRDDPLYPQVICIGSEESWQIIMDMINQVASVHKRFGMNYFHIGADEVFNFGTCNETINLIQKLGSRDKAFSWHVFRTANFVKKQFASSTTILAWHDMLVHMSDRDSEAFNLSKILEPILWSYAEDLDMYLPYSDWLALKKFKKVWGASAFKGADGPMRFYSNPIHYIRNHEAWIQQMTKIYKEFDRFQGLIITGWSRYDHLAVLCEMLPVGIPTLSMSAETILAGRPLDGRYEKTSKLLHCDAPYKPGFAYGCEFPGKRVYELVNEYSTFSQQLRKYIDTDFEFNGWVSILTENWNSSSPMYIKKVLTYINYYLQPLERIENELRHELNLYFYPEAVDEFILTYMSKDLELFRRREDAAQKILKQKIFPKRPFVKYPAAAAKKKKNIEKKLRDI